MPELRDSTPPPVPPPATSTTVNEWEKYEGFRFTFLLHFTLEEQAALQKVAQLLFDAVLEKPRPVDLPEEDGPWTRWEVATALGEMRYLEGYLGSIWDEHRVSSLPEHVEELSKFAGGISAELAEVSRHLEEGLHQWVRRHGSKR
jgi:hypothetical protein